MTIKNPSIISAYKIKHSHAHVHISTPAGLEKCLVICIALHENMLPYLLLHSFKESLVPKQMEETVATYYSCVLQEYIVRTTATKYFKSKSH